MLRATAWHLAGLTSISVVIRPNSSNDLFQAIRLMSYSWLRRQRELLSIGPWWTANCLGQGRRHHGLVWDVKTLLDWRCQVVVIIIIIIVVVVVVVVVVMFSYHGFSFPASSPLEPMANPTTHASSLRLQHWCVMFCIFFCTKSIECCPDIVSDSF
jgi:hypothetical protein